MDSIFSEMIDASVRRLVSDRKNGFAFLRQVPSTYAKLFVSYWEQAEAGYWDEYLKIIQNQYWRGTPRDFDEYVERVRNQWQFRPYNQKTILAMMFTKNGKVPSCLRGPEVTDVMLSKYANDKWPSEKAIKNVFGKHFEMELLHHEGSSDYRISKKDGSNKCETRLVVSTKFKMLSYFHILNDSSRFLLMDHSGNAVYPKHWDLVSEENMGSAALLLKKIVNTFETSVT